jgi:class 3 adenylate cyclase
MPEHTTVETLVSRYLQAEDDLAILGREIEAAGRDIAVAFIDLVGSTELKHQTTVARWLGYLLRFLERVSVLAAQYNGIVVKRIGDEVMLTFELPSDAERFIAALLTDDVLRHYRFKTAFDWGKAFPVSFRSNAPLDPYGSVIDRAARIAKLASAGLMIASAQFVGQLTERAVYKSIGKFRLKGLPEETEIYLRTNVTDSSDLYRSQLLRKLNEEGSVRPRFRYVPRHFTAAEFEMSERQEAYPFLARELLTLPLLPHDLPSFLKLSDADAARASEWIGHIVEWEAYFYVAQYRKYSDSYNVLATSDRNASSGIVTISCVAAMGDALHAFSRNDRCRLRGVLMGVGKSSVDVNYADIQVAG